MPTVDFKNKDYAVKTDITDILTDIGNSPDGLLLGGAAYKVVKDKLRGEDMKNEAVEVEPDTGYYIKSQWVLPGAENAVIVDYRVPMYTNSQGKVRNGKRLSLGDRLTPVA